MKALSLWPEWAQAVLFGEKWVECRSWKTDYRGDLLICASSKKFTGAIDSHAVCVATLEDIVPFSEEHLDGAGMEEMPKDNSYAWIFGAVTMIKPFPVKGKERLFEVDDSLIEYPEGSDYKEVLKDYYLPLVYFSKNDKESRYMWEDIVSGKDVLDYYCAEE